MKFRLSKLEVQGMFVDRLQDLQRNTHQFDTLIEQVNEKIKFENDFRTDKIEKLKAKGGFHNYLRGLLLKRNPFPSQIVSLNDLYVYRPWHCLGDHNSIGINAATSQQSWLHRGNPNVVKVAQFGDVHINQMMLPKLTFNVPTGQPLKDRLEMLKEIPVDVQFITMGDDDVKVLKDAREFIDKIRECNASIKMCLDEYEQIDPRSAQQLSDAVKTLVRQKFPKGSK